jgi:hypothetical protein
MMEHRFEEAAEKCGLKVLDIRGVEYGTQFVVTDETGVGRSFVTYYTTGKSQVQGTDYELNCRCQAVVNS